MNVFRRVIVNTRPAGRGKNECYRQNARVSLSENIRNAPTVEIYY